MLQIGAGHVVITVRIILELFGYDLFCNNLQLKKFNANLEV